MSELQANRRQEWTFVAATVLALLLLIAAGLTGWLPRTIRVVVQNGQVEAAARGLALLAAVVLARWIFIRKRHRLPQDTPVRDDGGRPDLGWLRSLRERAASQQSFSDPKVVALFVETLLDPVRYRPRVIEKIDLGDALITQQVTVEWELPDSVTEAKLLYLPVMRPRKGDLLDHFHLRDASGDSLPGLSYQELMYLSALGLRLLLTEAFARRPRMVRAARVQTAELALLGLISDRSRWSVGFVESEADRILRQIDFTLAVPGSRERIAAYVVSLGCSHPIIVVVPRANAETGRLQIRYQRGIVPYLLTRGWQGTLRLWFGLKPNKVAIPTELALTTRSYHLRVTVPSDKFILRQFLQCRHCMKLVTPRWRGRVPTPDNPCAHQPEGPGQESDSSGQRLRLRVRRRRGQNFANIYLRGFGISTPRMQDLQLLAAFYEVPPGARGRASITALVTTVLLLAVGSFVAGQPADQPTAINESVPALMLALPAVAASWFGATAGSADFLGGSLLARISLILSGVISAGAVMIYFWINDHANGAHHNQLTFFGVDNTWMGLLCIASVLNLAVTAFHFVLQLTHYNHLVRRRNVPEPDGQYAG